MKITTLQGNGLFTVENGLKLLPNTNHLIQLTLDCILNIFDSTSLIQLSSYNVSNLYVQFCFAYTLLSNEQIAIAGYYYITSYLHYNMTYLAIFNLVNGSLVKTLYFPIKNFPLIILNNGYLVGGRFGKILIYNLSEEKIIKEIKAHNDWIETLLELPQLGYLASGSNDKTIKIWDLNHNYKLIKTLEGHSASVWSLALLPDGNLVSGSKDQTTRIWDIKSWNQANILYLYAEIAVSDIIETERNMFQLLMVLANGKIVSGDCNGHIVIWNTNDFSRNLTIDTRDEYFYEYQHFESNGIICITGFVEMPSNRLAISYDLIPDIDIWQM